MRVPGRRAVLSALATVPLLPPQLTASVVAAAPPPYDELGLTRRGSLRGCPPLKPTESGCISSLPTSSPNRYSSPLRYDTTREQAFRRVRSYLAERSGDGTVESDSPDYLHAWVAVPEPADIELHFVEDEPVVTYRVLATKPTLTRPFCATRGCINGNQELRQQVERLRDENGWRFEDARFENERFEGWVPIFLH